MDKKEHFSLVLDLIYSKIVPDLNSADVKIPKNREKKVPKVLEKLVYDHLNKQLYSCYAYIPLYMYKTRSTLGNEKEE